MKLQHTFRVRIPGRLKIVRVWAPAENSTHDPQPARNAVVSYLFEQGDLWWDRPHAALAADVCRACGLDACEIIDDDPQAAGAIAHR